MRVVDVLRGAAALASSLRSQWRDPAWWASRQERLLHSQLAFAVRSVPFYRNRAAYRPLASAGVASCSAPLLRLPMLRRNEVQRHREELLAAGGDRRRWHRSSTSGSMGLPLEVWFDAESWRLSKYVLKARRLLASGWRPGHRVVIVVDDVPSEQLNAHRAAWHLRGGRPWDQFRNLSIYEPPQRHLDLYAAYRPHFIYAFPSYLSELSRHWDAAMRRRVPLRALMTSGETLVPPLRHRLAAAFGAPVLDTYGSNEFKEIAWQCPAGEGYHVNMDSVAVEVVDADGRPVPTGAPGELVVTSLINRAMPLIRYGTEDIGRRLAGRCACGRGLERLDYPEGRVADYVRLPDGELISCYEVTTSLLAHPDLLQFRIEHYPQRGVEVRVVMRDGAPEASVEAVRQALQRHIGRRVPVTLHRVEAIAREPSGKHRAFVARHPVEVAQ